MLYNKRQSVERRKPWEEYKIYPLYFNKKHLCKRFNLLGWIFLPESLTILEMLVLDQGAS